MALSGQSFINAPRSKVWNALLDASTLDACLREPNAVKRVSDTEYMIGAPIHGLVVISDSVPPSDLKFTAAGGCLRLTLTEEAPAMTLLTYELDGRLADPAQTGTLIKDLLAAFNSEVAGPRELAASGLAGVKAATERP